MPAGAGAALGAGSVLTCAGNWPQHRGDHGTGQTGRAWGSPRCDHPTPPTSASPSPSLPRRCLLRPTAWPRPHPLSPSEGLTMGRTRRFLPRPHICRGKASDKTGGRDAPARCRTCGSRRSHTDTVLAMAQHVPPSTGSAVPDRPRSPGATRRSQARYSTAWHGMAHHGTAQHIMAWHGMAHMARHGTAWPGLTLHSFGPLQAVQPVLVCRGFAAIAGSVCLLLAQGLCRAGDRSARDPPPAGGT